MKDYKYFSLYGTLAIVWAIIGVPIAVFSPDLFAMVADSWFFDKIFNYISDEFFIFIVMGVFFIPPMIYPVGLYLLLTKHRNRKGNSLPWYERATFVTVILALVFFVIYSNDSEPTTRNYASVKQTIGNIRNQMQWHYSKNLSYEGVCESDIVMRLKAGIEGNGATNYHCDSTTETYRVWARLKVAQEYFCADHTGFAGTCNPADFNNTLETVPN